MPGVGAQVVQFGAVLGRDDEAEMVPVVGEAFLESVEVGVVGLRPVGPARLAIAAGAVALDVAQVLGGRLRAGVALGADEGRCGEECCNTFRSGWLPYH